MSATNHRIIVWSQARARLHEGRSALRTFARRHTPSDTTTLEARYTELTALAAQLVGECRRLQQDNAELRAGAETWARRYDEQAQRAAFLEERLAGECHE